MSAHIINKRTICFFMLYHKREELTRMSMFHMAKVVDKFTKAGHYSIGIVFGDEIEQRKYAESLGLEHINTSNDPLDYKFSFAWQHALLKETDYICWLGSNNLNSDDYWNKCLDTLEGKKEVSFGTNEFTIVSDDKSNKKTCAFATRKKIHLCSSGQFYLNYSLSKAVNFRAIYQPNQRFDFDGKINEILAWKWGEEVIKTISSSPFDCLDIKNQDNIHSYESYISKYPTKDNRDKIVEQFEEFRMLEEGQFSTQEIIAHGK